MTNLESIEWRCRAKEFEVRGDCDACCPCRVGERIWKLRRRMPSLSGVDFEETMSGVRVGRFFSLVPLGVLDLIGAMLPEG